MKAFKIQFWSDGKWLDIPSAEVNGNKFNALAIPFDQNVRVETDKLRLWITSSHQSVARVKEIVIWPEGIGDLPALPKDSGPPTVAESTPQNQIVELYL